MNYDFCHGVFGFCLPSWWDTSISPLLWVSSDCRKYVSDTAVSGAQRGCWDRVGTGGVPCCGSWKLNECGTLWETKMINVGKAIINPFKLGMVYYCFTNTLVNPHFEDVNQEKRDLIKKHFGHISSQHPKWLVAISKNENRENIVRHCKLPNPRLPRTRPAPVLVRSTA